MGGGGSEVVSNSQSRLLTRPRRFADTTLACITCPPRDTRKNDASSFTEQLLSLSAMEEINNLDWFMLNLNLEDLAHDLGDIDDDSLNGQAIDEEAKANESLWNEIKKRSLGEVLDLNAEEPGLPGDTKQEAKVTVDEVQQPPRRRRLSISSSTSRAGSVSYASVQSNATGNSRPKVISFKVPDDGSNIVAEYDVVLGSTQTPTLATKIYREIRQPHGNTFVSNEVIEAIKDELNRRVREAIAPKEIPRNPIFWCCARRKAFLIPNTEERGLKRGKGKYGKANDEAIRKDIRNSPKKARNRRSKHSFQFDFTGSLSEVIELAKKATDEWIDGNPFKEACAKGFREDLQTITAWCEESKEPPAPSEPDLSPEKAMEIHQVYMEDRTRTFVKMVNDLGNAMVKRYSRSSFMKRKRSTEEPADHTSQGLAADDGSCYSRATNLSLASGISKLSATTRTSLISSLSRTSNFSCANRSSLVSKVRRTKRAVAATRRVESLEIQDRYGEWGTYTGLICCESGKPSGSGRLVYHRYGRWYQGDWVHGRWTGQGRLRNGKGDLYEGGFKNDRIHGFGTITFRDGRKFKGKCDCGRMVEGTMSYQDGSSYDGSWVNGMRDGHGRIVWSDNAFYDGSFKEGEFNGFGKMVWSDGGWYEGEWLNGRMHGQGKEVLPDGSLRHDGLWLEGMPDQKTKGNSS